MKNTLFIKLTPEHLRGRTFGFLSGFVQLGTPLAPLLAALIIARYPLWTVWVASGVVSLLLGVIYLTFIERMTVQNDSSAVT